VAARIAACQRCELAANRIQPVPGEGNPRARLFLIGTGPGAEDDRAGRPWQGEAGALLDRMLAAIGLTRAEVFLSTLVKCRLPADGRPGVSSLAACTPFLRTQLEAVSPAAVLLLGEPAARFLLRADLASLHGSWHELLGLATLATWAPEDLLADPGRKRQAWADLQRLRDRLAGGAPSKAT
jgi:DNA polymerase